MLDEHSFVVLMILTFECHGNHGLCGMEGTLVLGCTRSISMQTCKISYLSKSGKEFGHLLSSTIMLISTTVTMPVTCQSMLDPRVYLCCNGRSGYKFTNVANMNKKITKLELAL